MSVDLKTRQVGGVTVVDVSGRITLGDTASALRDTLRGLAGEGQKNILLNLGGLTFIDSSGLGVLVSGFATVANQGGKLKLLNAHSSVKDMLVLTKLYTVFEVFDSETTAVQSFA